MKIVDRVQAHTAERVNQRINEEARNRVLGAAIDSPTQVSARIEALDREWDIERWLEMNASALAFTGVVLGLLWNRKLLAIPCLVLPFLFQHAVQGWCPPIPILRRKGVRTRKEIDEEKFALKALRGDFSHLDSDSEPPSIRARNAWIAATA
jgi:hypothetical protein